VGVFWLGLAPEPVMNVMQASVANVLKQVGTASGGVVAVTSLMP